MSFSFFQTALIPAIIPTKRIIPKIPGVEFPPLLLEAVNKPKKNKKPIIIPIVTKTFDVLLILFVFKGLYFFVFLEESIVATNFQYFFLLFFVLILFVSFFHFVLLT